jgi:protein SCO1/2
MRALVMFLAVAIALSTACRRDAETRQYELNGQILAIQADQVRIAHQDIKGFMPGMTMSFKVKDVELLSGKQPGDLVTATLVVGGVEPYLSSLTKTGHTPLEAPPPVSDAPRILVPGEQIADALLVDQDGVPRPFGKFRGHRLAVTFIYTRCPFPEFCPLMDRQFAAVQKSIKSTPALSDVRLLSVTLDPEFDTPKVLKAHAQERGADPAVWSFMTGEPKDVTAFATQLGLYVDRKGDTAADIAHNLRTAIVDAEGRLVKAHSGNDWTPSQLVADLKATSAPKR